MVGGPPWLAVGALAVGAAAALFARVLWEYRDTPGGTLFAATTASGALLALSHGAALVAFDPTVREALEVPFWLGLTLVALLHVAFALEYTGRGGVVRSELLGVAVAVTFGLVAVVALNPVYHLAWTTYALDPAFGVARAVHDRTLWAYLAVGWVALLCVSSTFLLFDVALSYGPLYRRRALALALAPLPVAVGEVAWLFEVGPFPGVHLSPYLFAGYLVLGTYAFAWRDMFDTTPASRRAGERAAVADLGDPVVIVDESHRVIDLNEGAMETFDATRAALGRPLDRLVGDPIDCDEAAGEADPTIAVRTGGERHEYAVSVSSVEDPAGRHVGYTLVFQNVTTQRRRKQQLSVLNRILRHNLRNDVNAITGFAETIRERTDDPEIQRLAGRIVDNGKGLVSLGDEARAFERAVRGDQSRSLVDVRAVVVDAVDDVRERLSDGEVTVAVPEGIVVRTNPDLLRLVVSNLVENGIEHHTGTDPAVAVAASIRRADDRSVVIEIRDNGPGIPDHEVEILGGEEAPLRHGLGLGLWLVQWSVTALGGDVTFDADERGTTVSVRIPGLTDDPSYTPLVQSSAVDGATGGSDGDGESAAARTADDRDADAAADDAETDATDAERPGPAALTDIPGVGPARAESLRDAGYETVADVAAAGREDLAEVPGIGDAIAARIERALDEVVNGDEVETDGDSGDAAVADGEGPSDDTVREG